MVETNALPLRQTSTVCLSVGELLMRNIDVIVKVGKQEKYLNLCERLLIFDVESSKLTTALNIRVDLAEILEDAWRAP